MDCYSINPSYQKSSLQRLREQVILFVIQQIDPPALFLMIVTYVAIMQIEIPFQVYYALFIISIVFALLLFRNHFYFFNLAISGGIGWWAILNIFLCLLAANEKWKIYLLVSTFGSLLNSFYSLIYLALISSFLMYEIHRNLVFKTLKDNYIFYCGFGTLFVYALLRIWLTYLNEDHKYLMIIIPISLYTFHTIFKEREQKLIQLETNNIRSAEIAVHYINLIKEKLSNEHYKYSIIAKHKQNCKNPQCSCRISGEVDPIQHIQGIYQTLLQNTNMQGWKFLQNKYINFQLDEGRLIYSLIKLVKQQKNIYNYFRIVERLRLIEKLRKLIQKNDLLLSENLLHFEVLQYDHHCRKQLQEIIEILEIKIGFWKEVGLEAPRMYLLQKQGLLLVEKKQALHYFYQDKIKKKQEKLCCFLGTIYYSMFLLSTTNFKQYAETLLKATSRTLEEVRIGYNGLVQIQGFSAKRADILLPIGSGLKESNQLVVENVSKSFCRLLKKTKSQLVGLQINSFIPSIYWQVHKKGIKQFFSGIINKDSKFLGMKQDYPLRLKNNCVQQCNTIIKLYPHLTNELRFICLIEAKIRSNKLIITNFKRQNFGCQIYSKPSILENVVFKEAISKLQEDWEKNRKIQTKQLLLVQEQERYFIQIKSPFANKFEGFELPPLHILYQNQSQSEAENYLEQVAYYQIKNCTQKIQQKLYTKQTDSQTVATQGKSSIITILSTFTQSKKISFFQKIFYLMFVYFAAIITTNSIMSYTFTGLEELNSPNQNLMQNFKTVVDIQEGFLKVFIFVYDYQAVLRNDFTAGTLDQIYKQTKKQYLKTMKNSFITRFKSLNTLISYNLALFPAKTKQMTNQFLLKRVPFIYKGKKQQATILNLMKNCQLDVLLISQGAQFGTTLLSSTFKTYVQPYLTSVINYFSEIYANQHSNILIWNIIFCCSFSIILLLLIIPWMWFHHKLVQKNVAIYDLIVSTQVPLIKQEINILKNVKKMFNKIKYSEQFNLIQIGSLKNLVEDKYKSSRMSQIGTSFMIKKEVDQNLCQQEEVQLIQLRRRSGQLNLIGSEAQKKKINIYKWILPMCVLLTIILFVTSTLIKIQKSNQFRGYEQQFYKRHKIIALQHKLLMNIKYMYEETNKTALDQAEYKNMPLSVWFTTTIQNEQRNFQYRDFNVTPVNCIQSRKGIQICKNPNSQYSLSAILLKLVKQAFLQYQFEDSSVKEQHRTNLLFGQTVLRELVGMHTQIINTQIQLRQASQLALSLQLENIFIIGFVWAAVVFIVGLFFISYYRLKYVKQVTILLFLNMQMITSSKRVQSFLEKISREH